MRVIEAVRPVHALLGVAFFSALSAASCRDVVSGENVDVEAHLCERLTQCFGPEGTAACDRVKDAAPVSGEWSATLRAFEPCLEGDCGVIRACLDLPAFCISATSTEGFSDENTCATDFDCCGATQALAACENEGCCLQPGAPCDQDQICCGGLRCESNGSSDTCGGVKCSFVGDACESNGDCCTGICGEGGTCTNIVCLQLGEACDGGCCNGLECRGGVCAGPPTCAEENAPCDPSSSEACCDAELDCLAGPNGVATCASCGQEGSDCAQNSDCCSACVAIGGSLRCADAACGTEIGASCTVSTDCCVVSASGVVTAECVGGACVDPGCATDCHDACEPGPALSVSNECASGDLEAIATVIALDPYCGCEAWDSVCIGAYQMLGGSCPQL